jgi:predicted kinase
MKTIIFDVDGTLSNLDHRLHYVQDGNRDWNSFFREMDEDLPVKPIVWLNQIFWDLGESVKVIIVSARPEDYREVTEKWFKENNIFYDKFYMRRANDMRKDSIVKAEILQQILDDGYEPFIAIDDRDQVVEMWRSHGICTLQCAVDDSYSKYTGQTLLDIMVGPSGAGKSTYIKTNYGPEYSIISSDEIRKQLFGSMGPEVQSPQHHARVFAYAHALTKANLENGVPTVFDATNLRNKDRLAVVDCVPKGQLCRYVVIDRPYQEKEKTRDWRPIELLTKHENTFKSNLKDILNADNRGNVIVLDRRVK